MKVHQANQSYSQGVKLQVISQVMLHCTGLRMCLCVVMVCSLPHHRSALFFSNEVQQYAVPFMGADVSVVKRSQRYLTEELKESPVSPSLPGDNSPPKPDNFPLLCHKFITNQAPKAQ